MDAGVRIVSDTGVGRAFVILFEQGQYTSYASSVSALLAAEVRVVCMETSLITDNNWKEKSSEALLLVKSIAVKQASFVGFGPACGIVQAVYLREPKIVRTMILIDGSCRPHPGFISSWVDAIEAVLPLGLPLRATSKGFDSRSHLQRIRCPVLVLTLSGTNDFLIREAHIINRAMPTSWYEHLSGDKEHAELCRLVKDFQEVPARCPQKNLRSP